METGRTSGDDYGVFWSSEHCAALDSNIHCAGWTVGEECQHVVSLSDDPWMADYISTGACSGSVPASVVSLEPTTNRLRFAQLAQDKPSL